MKRILVVDDESLITGLVTSCLAGKYEVVASGTVADAQVKVSSHAFDLVLLDVNLPDGDGFSFCARLRNAPATRDLPIVFLTGKSEVTDRIMGYTLGADDYIQKPFDPDELCARIAGRLRRYDESRQNNDQIRRGNLFIDASKHQVFLTTNGVEKPIELTPSEFRILLLLVKSEEKVFSRDEIIAGIRGENFHLSSRTIDSHISNLRRKLAASSYTVKAVHGAGYKFTERSASAA